MNTGTEAGTFALRVEPERGSTARAVPAEWVRFEVDEVELSIHGLDMSNQDQCDRFWDPGGVVDHQCAAQPDQTVAETWVLYGPTHTTNGSSSFSTTLTWTALPPAEA